MFSKIFTTTTLGIEGAIIKVETNISNGIPSFKIVGLSDRIIKESCERVISAIRNSGLEFPSRKIRINLAPSELPKSGTGIDLAIALGIYCAQNQIHKKIYAFGELGLNGDIHKCSGLIQFIEQTQKKAEQDSLIIVPKDSFLVGNSKINNIFAVKDLRQAVYSILGKLEPLSIFQNTEKLSAITSSKLTTTSIDDIIGLDNVKRALLIAAAGGHHMLLGGTLGVGKTHIAKSINSLLPQPSEKEVLEIIKVKSATGTELTTIRPFREINRGITIKGLIGGGTPICPGEITLAHKGILFIDELAEYSTSLLNSLREPMENKYIMLANQHTKVKLPCDFTLIAATNLCPCGKEDCNCSVVERQRYLKHIPGAILNRIDLYTYVERVNIFSKNKQFLQDSYQRITKTVKEIQTLRFKEDEFSSNSQIPVSMFEKYCPLSKKAQDVFNNAIEKFKLSGRDYAKIIRTSRTIADIEDKDIISDNEILEALSYRTTSLRTEVSF